MAASQGPVVPRRPQKVLQGGWASREEDLGESGARGHKPGPNKVTWVRERNSHRLSTDDQDETSGGCNKVNGNNLIFHWSSASVCLCGADKWTLTPGHAHARTRSSLSRGAEHFIRAARRGQRERKPSKDNCTQQISPRSFSSDSIVLVLPLNELRSEIPRPFLYSSGRVVEAAAALKGAGSDVSSVLDVWGVDIQSAERALVSPFLTGDPSAEHRREYRARICCRSISTNN
ncbi:unnamed protein product [Pleuronectes platessa]|uniref:Uncharacterized protein n=1 Tax=Pleuronectes platessa TaxID=8262 RepID=A0A9N7UPN1_PLEPL|nr:unnamed protein product [Pleuronectes platessa]